MSKAEAIIEAKFMSDYESKLRKVAIHINETYYYTNSKRIDSWLQENSPNDWLVSVAYDRNIDSMVIAVYVPTEEDAVAFRLVFQTI